jgi:ribosome biogenesis GTPase A
MDEEEYFKKIFKQIKRNSTIILFVDVCELYSTFASRLFEVCIHQNFKMVIVINKIDTLPKDAIQV